jgi:hypothetical protein
MEIGSVMRPLALDAFMPVTGEGADPLAPAGPVATAPGAPAGHGLQSAAMQTLARPHAQVLEPLRAADAALATPWQAGHASEVVVEQLVPVTVSALQADPAVAWPLLRRGIDAQCNDPPPAAKADPPQATPERDREPQTDDAEGGCTEPDGGRGDAGGDFDDSADTGWCDALTAALREASAAKAPPQALLAAGDQWRRGRCVVLACPQSVDPAGPAWAFVLWPRPQRRPGRAGAPLLVLHGLRGLRVEARLQWSNPPRTTQWCHVRVVKEHHPSRGRQLVALDIADTPSLPCDVQLGPVLARPLRWCEVRVRIDAVRSFWAALGTQWSATVVVCSRPLAGVRRPDTLESTC